MLRVLNDEEIEDIGALGDRDDFEEFFMHKNALNHLTKTQFKQDIEGFIEWGNEVCDNPKHKEMHSSRMERKHTCPKCWESLKKLIEKEG